MSHWGVTLTTQGPVSSVPPIISDRLIAGKESISTVPRLPFKTQARTHTLLGPRQDDPAGMDTVDCIAVDVR